MELNGGYYRRNNELEIRTPVSEVLYQDDLSDPKVDFVFDKLGDFFELRIREDRLLEVKASLELGAILGGELGIIGTFDPTTGNVVDARFIAGASVGVQAKLKALKHGVGVFGRGKRDTLDPENLMHLELGAEFLEYGVTVRSSHGPRVESLQDIEKIEEPANSRIAKSILESLIYRTIPDTRTPRFSHGGIRPQTH